MTLDLYYGEVRADLVRAGLAHLTATPASPWMATRREPTLFVARR